MRIILLTGFIVILLAFGTYCVFFPRSVQEIAAKVVSSGITAKSSILRSYILSNNYIWSVRAGGLIAYIMATLLVVVLYWGGAE